MVVLKERETHRGMNLTGVIARNQYINGYQIPNTEKMMRGYSETESCADQEVFPTPIYLRMWRWLKGQRWQQQEAAYVNYSGKSGRRFQQTRFPIHQGWEQRCKIHRAVRYPH